jgi:hypothetical protein
MESVLNYLNDSMERNVERLNLLKNFIKNNPLKSMQEKIVNENLYYYIVYRKDKKIIQEYLGSKNKISLGDERIKLNEYNINVQKVKEKYLKLKEENNKFKKVFYFANKLYYENN